jgi:hypothetical protein
MDPRERMELSRETRSRVDASHSCNRVSRQPSNRIAATVNVLAAWSGLDPPHRSSETEL